MFTWSVLKNLTSLEFSKQNLKNVTHGSKAKTKLNLKKAWFPPGSLHLGRGTGRWTNKATLSWLQAQRSKTNKKEQRTEVSPGSMRLDMVLVQKWQAYLRTQMNCWAWNNDSTTTDKSESNWRLQVANKKMISLCSSKPASEFRGKKEDKQLRLMEETEIARGEDEGERKRKYELQRHSFSQQAFGSSRVPTVECVGSNACWLGDWALPCTPQSVKGEKHRDRTSIYFLGELDKALGVLSETQSPRAVTVIICNIIYLFTICKALGGKALLRGQRDKNPALTL